MANIIPPIAAKRARAEFRARFLLIGSSALLFCALCFIAASIPAELAVMQASPPPSVQTGAGDEKSELTDAKYTQALLSTLKTVTSTSTLDALTAIITLRQNGIIIDNITYTFTNHTIALDGKASTPSELNAFRGALESDPHFKDVSVPVGALLGQEGGAFTMALTTK